MIGNVISSAKELATAVRTVERPAGLFLMSVLTDNGEVSAVQYAEEDLDLHTVPKSHTLVYAKAVALWKLAKSRHPGIIAINCTVNDEVRTKVFTHGKVLKIHDLDA